ncbi:hypothetical protein EV126DRAFT_174845 [Verticillium dahliae]|nr:hypothetical protein EV126DRAFT_174845 [Verticillium dahliae]
MPRDGQTSQDEQPFVKRLYRRTRNKYINCKRRKVKCDEQKPQCANCIRFYIPCDLTPAACAAPGPPTTLASPAGGGDTRPSQSQTQTPIVHRRGRGRPRKDWGGAASSGVLLSALEQSVSRITHVSTPDSSVAEAAAAAPSSCQLNVADAELLLHFTLHTATSLGDTPTDP